MRMMANWVRTKSFDVRPTGLALPQGYEKNVTDEDAYYEVLEVGPDVTVVGKGDVITFSPLGGVMKFKIPEEDHVCYAVRDNEIIGIISPKED